MVTLEGEMSREAGGQGAHLSSSTWTSGVQFEILKRAVGSIKVALTSMTSVVFLNRHAAWE